MDILRPCRGADGNGQRVHRPDGQIRRGHNQRGRSSTEQPRKALGATVGGCTTPLCYSQLFYVSDHKPHLGQKDQHDKRSQLFSVSDRKPHLGQKDQHDKRSHFFLSQKDHHDERGKLFSVSDHKPHLGQKDHHSERNHTCLLSPITNLTYVGRITMMRTTTMREATLVCCLRSQTLSRSGAGGGTYRERSFSCFLSLITNPI